MSRTVSAVAVATEGNDFSASFHDRAPVESAGKSVAIGFLNDVIAESKVPRKVLADECGWSEGQFSKVASGQQGDPLDLVYRLPVTRAGIRRQFFDRLAASEQVADPLDEATEQLAIAAIRWFRVRVSATLPSRPRMVRASVPVRDKAAAR